MRFGPTAGMFTVAEYAAVASGVHETDRNSAVARERLPLARAELVPFARSTQPASKADLRAAAIGAHVSQFERSHHRRSTQVRLTSSVRDRGLAA